MSKDLFRALLCLGLLLTATADRPAKANDVVHAERAAREDTSWGFRPDVRLGLRVRRYRGDPSLHWPYVQRSTHAPWMAHATLAVNDATSATAGTPSADPKLWGADGNVLDMACSGNTLYIAGSFRTVGENTGGLVPVDAETGEVLRPFPKVAGSVYAIVPDSSGGWYIGGEFTAVDGKPRSCLAQVRADGSVSDWNPGVTGSPGYIDPPQVNAIAVSGNRVFVGGGFREIGRQPHENLGCVDATTGHVLDLNLDIDMDGWVHTFAVQGSTVFVGGTFTSIGGQARGYLAAVDAATGAVMPWQADADYSVLALLVRDDSLLVGGQFGWIAGGTRAYLAALDIRTAQLLPFNADLQGIYVDYTPTPRVSALALAGDTLFAAGNFTQAGARPLSSLAALNATTGALLSWAPDSLGPRYDGFPPPLVESLVISGRSVYIGGWFSAVGGLSHPGVAALSRESGNVVTWDPSSGAAVEAMAAKGDTVYIAGNLSFVGRRQHRAGLAAIDLTTGAVKPWNPNSDGSICTAIAVSGDRVFVSGNFANIGGQPQARSYFAALDTVNGEVAGWNPGANGVGTAFLLEGDTLYAGGEFTQIGGQPRSYVAALSTTTGEVVAWDPSADWPVNALARNGNTIYIGGIFQRLGGQWRRGIAAVDAASGALSSWNPDTDNSTVDALLVAGNTVYVGGGFNQVGGQPRKSLAALNAVTGEATAWDPHLAEWGAPTRVRALAVHDGRLYAGGRFGSANGQPRVCLAAVDTATGLPTAWDPAADGLVWSLVADGNTVYAGGGFTRAGGIPAEGLVAFSLPIEPGPWPATFVLGASAPNPARSLAVIPFALSEAAIVTLTLHDLQGRKVSAPLDHVALGPGRHEVPVNVERWSAGVYFCRLTAGGQVATRKLVIIQ